MKSVFLLAVTTIMAVTSTSYAIPEAKPRRRAPEVRTETDRARQALEAKAVGQVRAENRGAELGSKEAAELQLLVDKRLGASGVRDSLARVSAEEARNTADVIKALVPQDGQATARDKAVLEQIAAIQAASKGETRFDAAELAKAEESMSADPVAQKRNLQWLRLTAEVVGQKPELALQQAQREAYDRLFQADKEFRSEIVAQAREDVTKANPSLAGKELNEKIAQRAREILDEKAKNLKDCGA